ncbi:MAG: hypothetical protein AAFQ80_21535 [Cyanobacteria bacterium J06621_8]
MSEDIRFRFNFRSSLPPDPNDPNRTFSGATADNVALIYDIAGANLPLNNQQVSITNTKNLRGDFTLPASQTATVQLLPKLTFEILSDPEPELEIRGFLELSVPALGVSGSQTEAEKVPVLLQPEIRGTFLPNDFSSESIDFDQINYSILTASGQAFNEVEPDRFTPPVTITPELQSSVIEIMEQNPFIFQSISSDPTVQISELIANLATLDPSADNLRQISNLITEMGTPIVMHPETK